MFEGMSTNFDPFPSLRGRRYSPAIKIVVHNPKLLNKKRIILAFSLVIVVGILFVITNQPSSSFDRTALSLISFRWKPKTQLEQVAECHSFASLCSCQADRRGLHQNVISYSLYGNFSDPKLFTRYVEPIKIILANISQSYPGKQLNYLKIIQCFYSLSLKIRMGNEDLLENGTQRPRGKSKAKGNVYRLSVCRFMQCHSIAGGS